MFAAAIDMTANLAGFALLRDGKVLVSESVVMRGRDGAGLPAFVNSKLKEVGLTSDDVSEWSVGSGPGSFTALRIAAAFVAGLSFAKSDVATRCVPGFFALAANSNANQGDTIGCLYDGRNNEVVYCEAMCIGENQWRKNSDIQILNKEQATAFFSEKTIKCVAFANELDTIKAIVPDMVAISTAERSLPEVLAWQKNIPFDNDLTKLDYIRPAVITK